MDACAVVTGKPVVVQSWSVQAILLTNKLPDSWLEDPAGARLRRLIVFWMKNRIKRRDTGLLKRMESHELGAVLRAAVLAYHRSPRDKDLVSNTRLPREVEDARNHLMRQSNPLIDYLMTPELVRLDEHRHDPTFQPQELVQTPLFEFRQQFIIFLRRFKKGARKDVEEEFPFAQMNLKIILGDDDREYLAGVEIVRDLREVQEF